MWYSTYKDRAEELISQNLEDNTMIVMGSSEFGHQCNSKYHMKNMLHSSNVNLMILGSPWNQSLSHTIELGAIEKNVKNRKIVFLVSPTWFKVGGVRPKHFSLRFSNTEYRAFMGNENIPEDVKAYVQDRAETLLANGKGPVHKAKLIAKVSKGEANFLEKLIYHIQKSFAYDKEILVSKATMKILGKNDVSVDYRNKIVEDIDFEGLKKMADKTGAKRCTNEFMIPDKTYETKLKPKYESMADYYKDETLTKSAEYTDFEYFLKLTKALNIDTEVIILPINGYWYDYTGLDNTKREANAKKITDLCNKYGAKAVSMNKYAYEKYFFEDAVHPWAKGWVYINEEIYKFYNQN